MRRLSYRAKLGWLLVLAIAGSFAFNLGVWKLVSLGGLSGNFWITFPLFLLGFGAIFAFCMPYWRRLDDVQKQGQLTSWYWGGMAGAVLMLAWLVAMGAHRSEFGMGAGIMLLVQTTGFAVAWGVWGLRGRGQAE